MAAELFRSHLKRRYWWQVLCWVYREDPTLWICELFSNVLMCRNTAVNCLQLPFNNLANTLLHLLKPPLFWAYCCMKHIDHFWNYRLRLFTESHCKNVFWGHHRLPWCELYPVETAEGERFKSGPLGYPWQAILYDGKSIYKNDMVEMLRTVM